MLKFSLSPDFQLDCINPRGTFVLHVNTEVKGSLLSMQSFSRHFPHSGNQSRLNPSHFQGPK